jgi:hypothetical protein
LATKFIEVFTDDLDGSKATETVPFELDGIAYTIDLSAKNAAKLRKTLAPYLDRGMKVTPRRARKQRPEDTSAGRAAIRAWAWRTGDYPDLGERGRIPREIVEAWYAAGQAR